MIEPHLATQADRDFAAGWIIINRADAAKVIAGQWDHHPAVQATIEHRLSGASK